MLLCCGCSEISSTEPGLIPPSRWYRGYAMTPYLARIDIFPIKSMDGVAIPQAKVLEKWGARMRSRLRPL